MKKNRIRKIFSEDNPKIRSLTFFVILFLFCAIANAQEKSISITIKKDHIGVAEAFSLIKAQTNIYIMYENQIIDKKLRFPLMLERATLKQALDAICTKAGLKYEILDKHVLITKSLPKNVKGKKSHIVGQVLNEAGEALPGATIRVLGTLHGTIADYDGNYSIDAELGDTLQFSFIGMIPTEKCVKDESDINVRLLLGSNLLQEVEIVSTGYQSIAKDRATGSFSHISAKELEKVPAPNVVQRLEGQISGMKISLYSGDKTFSYSNTLKSASSATRTVGLNEYDMNIRGVTTFKGEAFPLVVVDGVITEYDLSNINPNDIDNITVLKDAAAASIWGVRAANGVIVITTKKGSKDSRPKVSFSTSLMVAGKPDVNYLKSLSSAEMLDYEKDLVDNNILTDVPASDYYSAQYLLPEGSQLALKLKAGTITQDQYDARVGELSKIDNRSQISKYLLQKASSQQYDLSVSGGGNNSDYFYSASYSKENTNVKRQSGERLTLTLNNNWKLFNWIGLSTSFKGTFFSYKNNGTALNELYPSSGRVLMPYENLADENGNGISYDRLDPTWVSTLSSAFRDWRYNYLDELALRDNKQTDNNLSGSIRLSIPLFKGFTAVSLLAIEKTFSKERRYVSPDGYELRNMVNFYTYPTASNNSLGITNGGILHMVNTDQNNHTFRQQFNYDNVINGIHRINALAGIEMRETNIGQSTSSLFGYNKDTGIANSAINFSNKPTYAWVQGYTESSYTTFMYGGYPTQVDKRRRFLSYYGNAAYTLLNRYSLSGSVRYDDYNNFGLDRKYRATPLYSFGAKWNLSREDFMKSVQWLNNLALRLTYGINGNLSLDLYPFTNISLSGNYVTGQPSASISSTANPELRWEKVYTTNVGVDFALFNSKVNGTVEYYNKRGRDLLYAFPIGSAYIGGIGSLLTRNAAAVDSHGIDANLNVTAYQDKDWQAVVGAQFSYNTNKVKDNIFFKENMYANYFSYYPDGIGLLSGYPTDKLLVYRNAGLDEQGLTQVYDENGGIIKASTTTITSFKVFKDAGRKTAPYFGSMNLNLRYKQFSLFALATYQFGNVFLRPTIGNYVNSTYNTHFDLSKDIANRWRAPGDENKTIVPRAYNTPYSLYRYVYSDANVLKGDYIRMRQVSLNYDIEKEWLSKFHIASARIALSVNNLGLLWTANKQGYDPDYLSSFSVVKNLPAAKSYTLTLNVNF